MSNNRWLNKNIFAMGMTSFLSDLSHETATALLPTLIIAIGAPASALGIIEGCANASISIMKLISGWQSDYSGKRKPAIAIGYLLAALGVGSFALCSQWIHIFSARVIAWLGKGLREPSRDALLVDSVSSPKYYGRVFGFHKTMDTLGGICGPALAALFIPYISLASMFTLTLIPGILAFLTIIIFVKEIPQVSQKKIIFFQSIKQLPKFFFLFLSAALTFGMGNFAISMLILQAIKLQKTTLPQTTIISLSIFCYVLYNITYAIFSYPMGCLGDIINKKIIVFWGYITLALTYLGFTLHPSSITIIASLFILAGFSKALVSGGERAIAAEILPINLRGTGYGLLSLTQGIGDLASSVAVGLLWTYFSTTIGFIYAATWCIIGGVILLALRNK